MAGLEKKRKRCGVLICGAYGMRNTGDEAVLDAILAEVREIDPDMPITVLSRAAASCISTAAAACCRTSRAPEVCGIICSRSGRPNGAAAR